MTGILGPTVSSQGLTVIARARWRSAGPDKGAVCRRLARLLQAADWQPVGLSPAAILCVRRLGDPLPGRVNLDHNGARLPQEWQSAMAGKLGALARQAARPVREAVAHDAECVLFADRAELLACLAMDWREGLLAARWWWRGLFPNLEQARDVAALWRTASEYAPGAARHLAARGQAVNFAAKLRDDEARSLSQSIAQRFGLPHLPLFDKETATRPAPFAAKTTPAAPASQPPAPWREYLPDSQAAGLTVEQQTFLGLALTLAVAPARARSQTFAAQIIAWRKTASRPPTLARPPETQTVTPLRPTPEVAAAKPPRKALARFTAHRPVAPPTPENEAERIALPTKPPARFVAGPTPSAAPDVPGTTPPPQAPRTQVFAQTPAPPRPDGQTPMRPRRHPAPDAVLPPPAPPRQTARAAATDEIAAPEEVTEAVWVTETSVRTEFGGLFYLLNLALYLELYGDFTKPLSPGLGLDIWDFVALLGRRLLGAKLENDAAWPLLAQLAGRGTGEPSGAGFTPPTEWRLPAQWLKPWPKSAAWTWRSTARRLQIEHPAGFTVADVKRRGEVEKQLAVELARFGDFQHPLKPDVFDDKAMESAGASGPSRPARLVKTRNSRNLAGQEGQFTPAPVNAPLERWLDWLWPYVEARLRLALGLNADEDLAAELCWQPARVSLTTTHLDVFYSLAGLSYAVRLSGLDRDPGWIPAAGKYVKFHYE